MFTDWFGQQFLFQPFLKWTYLSRKCKDFCLLNSCSKPVSLEIVMEIYNFDFYNLGGRVVGIKELFIQLEGVPNVRTCAKILH